jgi:hypothetical protein
MNFRAPPFPFSLRKGWDNKHNSGLHTFQKCTRVFSFRFAKNAPKTRQRQSPARLLFLVSGNLCRSGLQGETRVDPASGEAFEAAFSCGRTRTAQLPPDAATLVSLSRCCGWKSFPFAAKHGPGPVPPREHSRTKKHTTRIGGRSLARASCIVRPTLRPTAHIVKRSRDDWM